MEIALHFVRDVLSAKKGLLMYSTTVHMMREFILHCFSFFKLYYLGTHDGMEDQESPPLLYLAC